MLWRFLITGAVRVLGAGAQLLLTLGVARLAGLEEAGIFFFAYSIALILSSVARLGTELSGLRLVASIRERGGRREMGRAVSARLAMTLAFSLLLASGYAAIVAPLSGAQFGGAHAAWVVLLLSAALPAMSVLGLTSELLKAADRASLGITLQNITVPGFAAASLALEAIFQRPTALSVALAILVASWLSAAVSYWVWRHWSAAWKPTVDDVGQPSLGLGPEFRAILHDAPALLIVSTTSIVMQWIGSVLLGILAQPQDVAGYSVASRIAIAVSIVHSAASSVIAPKMAAAHATGDIKNLRVLSHQTSLLIFSTTFPVLMALFAFPRFWLSFFGPDLGTFAGALQILVIGQIFAALIGHSGTVLVMCGEFVSARWTAIVAATSLAILMSLLIPPFGAMGAAAGMAGGVISGHIAAVILVRRRAGFWSMPTIAGDFVALRGGIRK